MHLPISSNRDSSRVIIFEEDKVALIKRCLNDETYYVFPGGGIIDGDTPVKTAVREAEEELGVIVEIGELLTTVWYHGTHYYFLATIKGGMFGTGIGEEYTDQKRNRGSYAPVWLNKKEIYFYDIRPKEILQIISSL